MSIKDLKLEIIDAAQKAVKELIKVAKEDIIKINPEDDLAADKLKNAAASKKLAIFDAFDILTRIESEKELLSEDKVEEKKSVQGFAERRSK
jgi:hypothetical protein